MNPHSFVEAILNPQASVPCDVIAPLGQNPKTCFGVHRNNVIASLTEALQDTYPVVLALVGEEFFSAVAGEFVRLHPPRSPVMIFYGEGFSSFLEAFEPARTLPYLADVAKLEWQRVLSLNCLDFCPLKPDELRHLISEPEALTKSIWLLNPSVELIKSNYAIGSIWKAHQKETTQLIKQALTSVNPLMPESVLVCRVDMEVMMMSVDPAQAAFIAELSRQRGLAQALEIAKQASQGFELAEFMAKLIAYGVFV